MEPAAPLDIVTLVVLILGAFLDGRMAAALGPHLVIVLCAMAGAALRLSLRRPFDRKGRGLVFLFANTLTAVVIAAPAAEFLASHTEIPVRMLFGPLALVLGRYGEECWQLAIAWAKYKAGSISERWQRGKS